MSDYPIPGLFPDPNKTIADLIAKYVEQPEPQIKQPSEKVQRILDLLQKCYGDDAQAKRAAIQDALQRAKEKKMR